MKHVFFLSLLLLGTIPLSSIYYQQNQLVNTPLDINQTPKDPRVFLSQWLNEAKEKLPKYEVISASVASASLQGVPSCREMIIKLSENKELSFHLGKSSLLARNLFDNPNIAVVFYWPTLQKQILIQGKVRKFSEQELDDYFQSRQTQAKISSWASVQGDPVKNKDVLNENREYLENRLKDSRIETPASFTGFIIIIENIEFWQAGAFNFHDRICYIKNSDGGWKKTQLSP